MPSVGPRASRDAVHVVSHFGPSTFEAGVNLNDSGKPFRYPYKQVLGIADAVRPDLHWFGDLTAEIFLSSEQEVAAVKAMMPPNLARVPQYYIALGPKGGRRQMKAYFCPPIKQMTTGINLDDASFTILSRRDA
ncbi:hypothetical protein DL765_007010 [Monosporascus sp. GIB2]|nr:hypothetical protein DL765_007010 [Monosporascus sp. GIB2]